MRKRSMMLALIAGLAVAAALVMPVATGAQEETYDVFITEDGTMSVWLKEGWFAAGNAEEGLMVADSLATMSSDGDHQPGAFFILVLPLRADLAVFFGLPEDAPLEEVITIFGQLFASEDAPVPDFSDPELIDWHGVDIALAEGGDATADFALGAYILAPDTYGLVLIATAPGEYAGRRAELLDTVMSTRYSLPLEEVHQSSLGFTIELPLGWTVVGENSAMLLASNDETALDTTNLADDQYALIVMNLGPTENSTQDFVAWVGVLLEEGDEVGELIVLDIDGVEVLGTRVTKPTDGADEGGAFAYVRENGDMMAIIYATDDNAGYLVEWTALHVLLSIA